MAGMKRNLIENLPIASLHRAAGNLGIKHHMALSKKVLQEILQEQSFNHIKNALK